MTTLLDANVLIAMHLPAHLQHQAAWAWFNESSDPYATCPITQGALVRFVVREGATSTQALDALAAITADPRHEFWPDALPFDDVRMAGVIGHRQVTDAYLAHLARSRHARLATFDQGLASLHCDVAYLLIP
jgi:toxin-antitoxin system PIN domain toxin